jgi:hypothetical protein
MRICMSGNQNARKHHLGRETLVHLYETECLSIAEIQKRTGCQSIHAELVRYGIQRRTRRICRLIEPSTADFGDRSWTRRSRYEKLCSPSPKADRVLALREFA